MVISGRLLRDHNNSASVTLIVNQLYETLGFEMFHKVFPSVWLLDNGSEFSDPADSVSARRKGPFWAR